MLLLCFSLDGHGTSTWPPESFSSVVVRKAVLQAATYPPRNAPAKVRTELVEMWNGLGFTPSLFQTVILSNVACNHESFYIVHLIFPYFKLFLRLYYCIFSQYGNDFDLCLSYFYCRRGNNHFDVHFRRIGPYFFLSKDGKDAVREWRNGWKCVYFPPESGPYFFLSKDGKDAVREWRNGWKCVYFPPESASFSLINNMIKVFFPICTLIWRVNNYVSRQGKV